MKAEAVKRHPRPTTRFEMCQQVDGVYRANGWNGEEQAQHKAAIGVSSKPTTELTDEDLKVILDDFENARMILYSEPKQI